MDYTSSFAVMERPLFDTPRPGRQKDTALTRAPGSDRAFDAVEWYSIYAGEIMTVRLSIRMGDRA